MHLQSPPGPLSSLGPPTRDVLPKGARSGASHHEFPWHFCIRLQPSCSEMSHTAKGPLGGARQTQNDGGASILGAPLWAPIIGIMHMGNRDGRRHVLASCQQEICRQVGHDRIGSATKAAAAAVFLVEAVVFKGRNRTSFTIILLPVPLGFRCCYCYCGYYCYNYHYHQ